MMKNDLKQEKNKLHISKIEKVIDLFEKKNISELEVECLDFKIKIKKYNGQSANMDMENIVYKSTEASISTPSSDKKPTVDTSNLHTVKSPMVGTFYNASSPTAEAFVKVGDIVHEGQVLCIIEAMKIMNEIESDAKGRVESILIENGHPVEYGEPLILLNPL